MADETDCTAIVKRALYHIGREQAKRTEMCVKMNAALEAKDAEIKRLTAQIEIDGKLIATLQAERDHWSGLVSRADHALFPFALEAKDAEIAKLTAERNAMIEDCAKVIDMAKAEIAKLTQERDDFVEQIALRQPTTIERDMQEIMRINNELRAALEPFAKMADQVDDWQKGTGEFTGHFEADHLRAARTALEQSVTGGKE